MIGRLFGCLIDPLLARSIDKMTGWLVCVTKQMIECLVDPLTNCLVDCLVRLIACVKYWSVGCVVGCCFQWLFGRSFV